MLGIEKKLEFLPTLAADPLEGDPDNQSELILDLAGSGGALEALEEDLSEEGVLAGNDRCARALWTRGGFTKGSGLLFAVGATFLVSIQVKPIWGAPAGVQKSAPEAGPTRAGPGNIRSSFGLPMPVR